MKKIIFTLAIALLSSLAFVSCTEEEVTPSLDNGGTVVSDNVRL